MTRPTPDILHYPFLAILPTTAHVGKCTSRGDQEPEFAIRVEDSGVEFIAEIHNHAGDCAPSIDCYSTSACYPRCVLCGMSKCSGPILHIWRTVMICVLPSFAAPLVMRCFARRRMVLW